MQLSEAQRCELLRMHGTYLTEVCDKCGALLGPIRWTIHEVPGAWCSRSCRDGVNHQPGLCRGCGTALNGKRRRAIYCDRTCRMRTVRKEVRDSSNIVNTPIQKTGVTDAISGFGHRETGGRVRMRTNSPGLR
jgi:hypothetical protein